MRATKLAQLAAISSDFENCYDEACGNRGGYTLHEVYGIFWAANTSSANILGQKGIHSRVMQGDMQTRVRDNNSIGERFSLETNCLGS